MAFIPKQYKKETVTIRIREDVLSTVDVQSEAFQMSRSAFINQCINYALEHLEDFSDETRTEQ